MRPNPDPSRPRRTIPFDQACSLLQGALDGPFRQDVVDHVAGAPDFKTALLRLRDGMRTHAWKLGARRLDLARLVTEYDQLTRVDGFRVLHDWDGKADTVTGDTIPVQVSSYVIDQRGDGKPDRIALAILLDYYFFYLLALLSLRVWDDDLPDANLDRLNELLGQLQGATGSGQRFAANAETLILVATSHFEIEEHGYGQLLERSRLLNHAHRLQMALSHAVCMGCHLRYGFEATYGRDTVAMRDDNGTDYPWLSFALATLMDEYARLQAEGIDGIAREDVIEGIANGLSPDPKAFVGESLTGSAATDSERSRLSEQFHAHRQELVAAFEPYRPPSDGYSPLSLFFNFSHNVLKGMIVDAALWGEARALTLNDLFTARPRDGAESASKEKLAKTLMRYARASPDRVRGRLMPAIVYDPSTGRQAFTVMLRKLQE